MRKKAGLGIHLPSSTDVRFAQILSFAKSCEKLGFDSIWVAERVLTAQGGGEGVYDSLSLLAALSAATETIKLGTSVLLVPLRNPLLLANATGTIQRISGGRFILGVGVGWSKNEFENLGISFRERGSITDEALKIIRTAWRGKKVTHSGKNFRMKGAMITSPPAKEEGIPIWIGGNSVPAIRRAARHDAWFPTDPTLDEIRRGIKELRGKSGEDAPMIAAHIYLVMETTMGKASRTAQFLSQMTGEPLEKVKRWAIVGDFEEARRRLDEYIKAGVEYFVFSLPRTGNYAARMGQARKVCSSLHLI